jgi:hypothetical protein
MSEIPDWLVELASQQGEDDDAEEESEWDFLRAEPAVDSHAAAPVVQSPLSEPAARQQAPTIPQWQAPAVADDAEDDDLMAALRTQAERVEAVQAPESRRTKSALDFRVAGLQPWQQLVLAILVFLDAGIIGLLFLVMLGRVAIP